MKDTFPITSKPMQWTEEQIIALSPDASSARSGKELASPAKWSGLGMSNRAIWGECQGSGVLPYRTQIDLRDTAFKCSCPSRKFPCKHGLGLLLLFASQPALFYTPAEPAWAQEWLNKRSGSLPKAREQTDTSVNDTKSTDKRIKARTAKVEAGLEEIELWVKDLIRNGLLTAPDKSPAFWQTAAARMIDAQAPGLERIIRNLGEINYYGEDWQSQALGQLCRLYLLIQSYKRMDTLPEPLQADIRSLIGWTQKAEDLKANPGIRDHWLVLGRQMEQDRDIMVQKNWLFGTHSQKFALILNFAHKTQTIDISLVPGTAMEAELVFYPGSLPLRALLKERIRTVAFTSATALPHWQAMLQQYTRQLSIHPWLLQWPVMVENLMLIQAEKKWMLQDTQNRIAPVHTNFDRHWKLLAYSGGHPLTLFLLYENSCFLPLGFWQENQYIVL